MKNHGVIQSLHEELICSLHDQLSDSARVIICNTAVGSRWLYSTIPVPDIIMFRKSYTKPDITVFEIKASKQDFNSDVREGKYRRYFDISNRVYFACESGMLEKKEVPEGVGLYVYSKEKKSWHVVIGAQRRECELDRIDWMSLLFAQKEWQIRIRDMNERLIMGDNIPLEDVAKNLPYKYKDTIRNHREALKDLQAREKELLEILGMEVGGWWEIRNKIEELKKNACVSDRKLVELGFDLLKDALEGISNWSIDERITQLDAYKDRIQKLKNKEIP